MLATVREWHDEEGWGVAVGDDFPDPVWVHFTAITPTGGYRDLSPGQRIEIDIEGPLDQDGFRYRALAVRAVH